MYLSGRDFGQTERIGPQLNQFGRTKLFPGKPDEFRRNKWERHKLHWNITIPNLRTTCTPE
eukprot:Gb_04834 [translate_table: standard]